MSKPPKVQAVANRAQGAGLKAGKPAASPLAPCMLKAKKKPAKEYCDLKTLKIQMNAPDKDATITLDRVRRTEKVDPSTSKRYRRILGSRDIVIEALADIVDKTTSGGKTQASKSNRPLKIIATATNSCSHSSFSPRHPTVYLGPQSGSAIQTEAGRPATTTYASVHPGSFLNSGLAALWPFSGSRVRNYKIEASSCANLPIPRKTIGNLSAQLYVFPYEEWGINIGLGPKSSGSSSTTQNFKRVADGRSGRMVERKTVIKKMSGSREISTTTEAMRTKTGIARTRVTDESRQLNYSVLGPRAQAIQAVQEDWRTQTQWRAPTAQQEYRKIKITHKVAGQEIESDVNELIKSFFEVKELVDKIKKIFDSVKFGASFSVEYELFSGSLAMSFGNKWPNKYAEQSRVYYVGHFIQVEGTVNPFDAKVTGFCGLSVESPTSLIDFKVEIGGYLSAAIKTPITANLNHAWEKDAKDWTGTLSCSPSFNLEGGFKANGRAFGYSVEGRIALEYKINFTLEGEISTRHPLTVKSSLTFGTEGDNSTSSKPEYAAVRLVAELKTVGSSVHTWKIKPYVLLKGAVAWKDYYIIGDKPKD